MPEPQTGFQVHGDATAEVGEDSIGSLRAAMPLGGDRLLADSAKEAGFAEIEVSMVVAEVLLPPIAYYYPIQILATPWGMPFSQLPSPARDRVVQHAVDLLAGYWQDDGQYLIPFASYLLLAQN